MVTTATPDRVALAATAARAPAVAARTTTSDAADDASRTAAGAISQLIRDLGSGRRRHFVRSAGRHRGLDTPRRADGGDPMDAAEAGFLRARMPRIRVVLMLHLALKALISGVLVAVASTLAKRYPGFGALVASLPLVSVLGMIWLWNEKPDAGNMAAHAAATFWFVLPSLPMFLLIPMLLRHGLGFWAALAAGCLLTVALYAAMTWIGPRLGLQL